MVSISAQGAREMCKTIDWASWSINCFGQREQQRFWQMGAMMDSEVFKRISNLDPHKGSKPDNVPQRFFKECKSVLSESSSIVFNHCLTCGTDLKRWNVSSITPRYKSGPKQCVRNYRPLSILNVPYKILDSLVADCLKASFNNVFIDEQHAFPPYRSTVSNLTVFREFVTETMDKNHQVDAI
ncbi:uncharacterized protein LOC117173898 [Belonocnema kinseyi]|uniref:uncharacterized protein LOC117173898 n=1 Tax=Belonocnema kinseyi TaxID=2817044 RepID=UPI00143DE19D|nr:uncharacterized protein LOC117173898 [Belonocnema kinseyi]